MARAAAHWLPASSTAGVRSVHADAAILQRLPECVMAQAQCATTFSACPLCKYPLNGRMLVGSVQGVVMKLTTSSPSCYQ